MLAPRCDRDTTGVAVYYVNAAGGKGCRVAELPMVESNWSPAYNPANVQYSAGTMSLVLDGTQGTRVASKGINFLYGSYQVKAAIPCSPGVISSFYVSAVQCIASYACTGVHWTFLCWLLGRGCNAIC